jgi:hypothetical protein
MGMRWGANQARNATNSEQVISTTTKFFGAHEK